LDLFIIIPFWFLILVSSNNNYLYILHFLYCSDLWLHLIEKRRGNKSEIMLNIPFTFIYASFTFITIPFTLFWFILSVCSRLHSFSYLSDSSILFHFPVYLSIFWYHLYNHSIIHKLHLLFYPICLLI